MTQTNIATARDITLAAKESTFGVLPTMKPLIIEADSYEGEQNKAPLDDLDSSPQLLDERNKVDGLFEGSAKFKAKLKPFATQGTSTPPVTQPALVDVLECILGGVAIGAGSAISAGTTSSVTVASAAGFTAGQLIGISGSSDCQIAVVESISTNDLNIWPALGTAVTSGNAVNGYNCFVTGSNTKSFSLQHAYPDSSSEQQEFRGCMGKVKFNTELGALVSADFEAMPATGQQGSLSVSTAVQTNPLSTGGHAVKNAILYIQTSATTTRTNYCAESFSLEYDPGIVFTPCITGTEGKDGVFRTSGRGTVKLMLKIKADAAEITTWAARTARRVLFSVPTGSGTSKRHVAFYMPKAVLARSPKQSKEGGRLLYELEFVGQIDNSQSENSLLASPLIVGLI